MKRIKLFSLAAIFCAATFVGYNAYQQSTMTEQERLMQANIEALSQDEDSTIIGCNYYCIWNPLYNCIITASVYEPPYLPVDIVDFTCECYAKYDE